MANRTGAAKPVVPVVKNEPPDEVAPEILAKAIVEVSEAAKRLLNGRLSRRAIFILIRDMTGSGIGIGVIEEVLDCAAKLKDRYVRSA